ncbi:uncharacterized protein LOC116776041 [Danaus plexippus]|uniref:uncharacterized protein LOC116776041 n=1 Tax=Danaus plexippus TaxID=13037 RepID=UPI002AB0CF54|nr:uncharacterized protein LOC116776041 [Danaus plexippus]
MFSNIFHIFQVFTVVCLSVLSSSHRLGFRRPENDFDTDVGSDIGSDFGSGLDVDAPAAANAEAVADGTGTATANAKAVARGSGRANAVARAVANSMSDMFGPRSRSAASSYEKGVNFGENQFNSGASGTESQSFYKRGHRNFYNHEHHHSKVTKVEHAETSDEHDIGGSQANDGGAHKSNAFDKYENGASFFGNTFENDAQEVETTL